MSAMEQGARVIYIPPPLYYGAAFAIGMLIDRAIALPVHGRPATVVIGWIVLVLGLALTASGVAGVIRHRTTIVPHKPVATLVTGGGYRISRNPMYTGLAIVYIGGSLVAGSWWPLLVLPLVLIAIRQLVIKPEEAYLTSRFGAGYTEYQARVRRWL